MKEIWVCERDVGERAPESVAYFETRAGALGWLVAQHWIDARAAGRERYLQPSAIQHDAKDRSTFYTVSGEWYRSIRPIQLIPGDRLNENIHEHKDLFTFPAPLQGKEDATLDAMPRRVR